MRVLSRLLLLTMALAFLAACGNADVDKRKSVPAPQAADGAPVPGGDDPPGLFGSGTGSAGSGTTAGSGAPGAGQALTTVEVFTKYCAGCHDGSGANGGLGKISDLTHLVKDGYVVAGDLANSKLYGRLINAANPMPPTGKPAPTAAEIKIVADWILAGAPVGTPPPVAVKERSPEEVFLLIAQDLQGVATRNHGDAAFTRYVSFAHLAATGALALADDANGMARLLNSLSTNARITLPVAVDAEATIFRFDLRDFNWTRADWERILNRYPYVKRQRSDSLERQFRDLAETELPVVNGDWASFTLSQAPLYNLLLRLPNQESGLEASLNFSIRDNLLATLNDTASGDTQVLRAGFRRSGVALSNRVVERHQTAAGSYWRSYDFRDAGAAGGAELLRRKNVFASPLGSDRELPSVVAFQEDAGEIIFSLPNGLQGYFLVDQNARSIDAAALDVAQDPHRRQRTILNGYSCFGCHTGGILPKKDEVTAATAAGGGFTADELTLIRRLYGNANGLNDALLVDVGSYTDSLQRASFVKPSTTSIVALGNVYENDLTLADASTVLGVTTAEFMTLLANSRPALKEALAGLQGGGTIQRSVFEDEFPRIVQDFFGDLSTP